jgi:RIO-like serine/threonine protein kinase
MLYHKKKVIFIDVGQAVESSHPRAQEYLYRDCVNVCRFFDKIGEPSTPTPQALYHEVTGKTMSLDEAAQYRETINSSRGAPKHQQQLAHTDTYVLCTYVCALTAHRTHPRTQRSRRLVAWL